MRTALTDKQQNILDYIGDFIGREGMPPTITEVATAYRIKTATAFAHIRALQRKGFVSRTSKARSLTLTRSTAPRHLSLTLSIPILGRINAGLPLMAEQQIDGAIQVDPSMLPRGIGGHRLFGLRIVGDSMRDKAILEGDIVIVKEQASAQIGQIVVAMVDGEATVKSFYLGDGQVELRPANARFESQFYAFDEVVLQGVVIALHRSCVCGA